MVFPSQLDFKTWVQVIPDFMHYIDHVKYVFTLIIGSFSSFVEITAFT
jgi:hypothetical protein